MRLKKLSKTVVTALAVAALGFGAIGLTANAEPDPGHEHTPDAGIEIYRLYNPYNGEHLYTKDTNERDYLDAIGWNYEGIAFKAASIPSTRVYRLYNPNSGEHMYTSNGSEMARLHTIGWNLEGDAWYINDECTKDVYRLYNPNATGIYEVGAHHYTANEGEKDWLIGLGWQYEGVGWKVIE